MARKKLSIWKSSGGGGRRAKDLGYRAPMLMGAAALVLCVTAAGTVVGVSKLWHAITHMQEFHVYPGRAAINSDWVREDMLRQELLQRDASLAGAAAEREADAVALLGGSCSIFEDDLALRVSDAYRRSPYVRRVRTVRKEFPNRLDIRLEMREPFALIRLARNAGKAYVVDEEGVVLSKRVYRLTPERLAGLLPSVVVSGARGYPCPGRVWGDVAVQEGVKMLRLCREQFLDEVEVAEIEVTRAARRDGTVSADAWLVLKGGTRVQWGSTPSAMEPPGVASTPERTAAFLALVRKEGEQLSRRRMVDLRLKTLTVE